MFKVIPQERTGALLLILCTITSIVLANTAFADAYKNFWHFGFGHYTIEFVVNDILMCVFFLQVGLEIKKELISGELSGIKKAILPGIGAVGGMIVPAAIHFWINRDSEYVSGTGIPTATDIAFSLAILSLLIKRLPTYLKIFLLALAIIDDLGAIIVIAVFYSKGFSLLYFSLSMAVFAAMLVLNYYKVKNYVYYLLVGIALWFFMYKSGIHTTIAGVLIAFAIPYRTGRYFPGLKLLHKLEAPVALIILPLFALANTLIHIPDNWIGSLFTPNSMGIILGLVAGKPFGIVMFVFVAVMFGIGELPKEIKAAQILGVGALGGIGFTMSIFITLLAFDDNHIVNNSKLAILVASCLAGIIGYVVLLLNVKVKEKKMKIAKQQSEEE